MTRTRGALLALALLVAVGGPVRAGDDAQADLAALEARYEEAPGSYPERFAAVKAAYEAFADAHARSEEGLTALLFLLRNTWWERQAGTMNASAGKLVERILAEHGNSPRLVAVVETKYVLSAAQRETVLPRLLAESPHDVVKAEALLALAVGDVRGANAERGRERLVELRERFGDVERRGLVPYGEYADAHLAPHDAAALAVGRKAPEIVGRDVDGEAMKLSDHLGKVVVLDFWGDW